MLSVRWSFVRRRLLKPSGLLDAAGGFMSCSVASGPLCAVKR